MLAAFEALDEAFERRDADAILALCTDDVTFIGSGFGEEAVGRSALARMFAALGSEADTGVLVRADGVWRWRVHHGSEPATW